MSSFFHMQFFCDHPFPRRVPFPDQVTDGFAIGTVISGKMGSNQYVCFLSLHAGSGDGADGDFFLVKLNTPIWAAPRMAPPPRAMPIFASVAMGRFLLPWIIALTPHQFHSCRYKERLLRILDGALSLFL
jgi:hypothetical protein